ncbi:MAG: UDP-N-acetylglucosamine 4,6-dehydratase (inverting) [Parachlamydiaceae bacterium]|nr:UDP-N-acetylglucosamine 4,6-dehydratase (inverting) [Parachlamydiaceae bacterium]
MTANSIFKNHNVLITGGTGSFGQAFARKLLQEDMCNKVIIFSRDEWKQWQMRQSDPLFNHPKIRYFLGDVRDAKRLARAFNEVHTVVHAAALKQVPAAEYNPSEFINTNVLGAMNVIDAAIDCKVERVISLSTDKAVNPVNLYGATKLCSDKLFVAGNSYVGARGFPRLSVVRYGNVSGSRGSIVPLWRKMLQEGATHLPITDARMTRFWITIDQAVDFVVKCFIEMRGGEIFVPKIPSIRIEELAKALSPNTPHEYCGIREGEKLHELMISVEDARHSLEMDDHYIILPEAFTSDQIKRRKFLDGRTGKPLVEGFAYTSDTNSEWLNIETLRQLIEE